MKKTDKEEKPKKKIRKPKQSNLNDKRFNEPGLGRIPNSSKELTFEEKNICYLVAMGMSREAIMKRLDITAHIYRKTEKDERFIEEIKRLKEMRSAEDIELWIEQDKEFHQALHNELMDMLTTKEAREKTNFYKMIYQQWKDNLVTKGVYEPPEGETTETTKHTQIQRKIGMQKRLPHTPAIDVTPEPDFFTEDDSKEEFEESMEVTKKKGKNNDQED